MDFDNFLFFLAEDNVAPLRTKLTNLMKTTLATLLILKERLSFSLGR